MVVFCGHDPIETDLFKSPKEEYERGREAKQEEAEEKKETATVTIRVESFSSQLFQFFVDLRSSRIKGVTFPFLSLSLDRLQYTNVREQNVLRTAQYHHRQQQVSFPITQIRNRFKMCVYAFNSFLCWSLDMKLLLYNQ